MAIAPSTSSTSATTIATGMDASPSAANAALIKLADLLHSRAEIFAGHRDPSTSTTASPSKKSGQENIYEGTLKATKQLFDESLQSEATSLDALVRLVGSLRGVNAGPSGRIETRSRSTAVNWKGRGNAAAAAAALRKNPIFRQTPLQELYLGDEDSMQAGSSSSDASAAEIAQRMVWEQLELRTSKVLDAFREIINQGDRSDDEDAGEEDSDSGEEDDEDEEEDFDMEDGQSLSDEEDEEEEEMDAEYNGGFLDDEDMEDLDDEDMDGLEDDEDEREPAAKAEPYFTQLRDASATEPSASALANGKSKGKAASKTVTTTKGNSPVDSGFFSLAEFNSQTFAGEDEMRRFMRSRKSKSVNDSIKDKSSTKKRGEGLDGLLDEDDDEEDDENEEIDYFAPAAGTGDSDEDEDGEEEDEEEDDGEIAPENMRYEDFWNPPTKLYHDIPGSKPKVTGKEAPRGGKGKQKQQQQQEKEEGRRGAGREGVNGRQENDDIPVESPKKRRVSFHDAVKVQEYEIDNPDAKKSALAALVKRVGMKEAMRRMASGEMDEEEEFDEDDEEGSDDIMLSDMLDDDEEDDEEEEEEGDDGEDDDDAESMMSEEDGGDADTRVMRRIDRDLFAEDEDDDPSSSSLSKEQKAASQSRYEARMSALSEQIAELEAENVAEKDWTLKGEAKSRDRPVNSLLEEDLEFDQVAKVVPVVTEESSLSLEDKIKQRIIEDNFDDVVRRRVQESAAYLPSRLLDIKNTASERSLAEIYADEFSSERARAAGEDAAIPEVDAKLQKEHDSISAIFDEVCNKLDALSNARFTPKAAQTQITTITNAPSVSLESALPTGASTSTLLAPEEVYAPSQRGGLTSKSEMTPSQKKAERARARKAKQVTMQAIQKYGGNSSKNVAKQKDRAMNSLIGKRGVTVLGKGKAAKSALTGKDRRAGGQQAESKTPSSGNAYKL